ncbi:hypothetical protein B0H66DRAFT_63087 [Apodospora peruviana]|uniref:C2H2-type domain-containing protein n=1 Tax=Apodospora peruviana TaxID=516989 RepID=A0AAE0ISZ6_9PEZI|nr:hypothetical protein B0H66DRAFT_63087 [Apodospora peruviana]
MTTLFSARSVIAARSSSLSGGVIAGAVVGSVVGAVLIILCLYPFVVRARRRRLNQDGDSALQAELGQSLGGPLSSHDPPMEDISKRLTTDYLVPGPDASFPPSATNGHPPINGSATDTGHDFYHKVASYQKPLQPPVLPLNVSIHQGLPSPISAPVSPTSRFDTLTRQAIQGGQAFPSSVPVDPAPPSTDPPARSRSGFGSIGTIGTVGKDSTRELSLVDSYGPAARDITPNGMTAEPDSIDHQSSHHHFPHIPESIRSFIHRRTSGHRRRDSRRSTHGTDGTRSPSIITTEALPPAELAQPVFDIDFEARGEAWSYYHPYLSNEPQDTQIPASSAPPPAATSSAAGLTVIPPAHVPFTAPLSPVSPAQQAPTSGVPGRFMTTRPVVDEPDAISPDSDKTVTPKDHLKFFSRQSSLLGNGKRLPGEGLPRTDSLPIQTIVSDIPSPPLQLTAGPSGNPMDLMKPTNDAESAWRVEQELIKMENSPPPESVPTTILPTVDEHPDVKPKPSLHLEEYQSPPDIEVNGEEIEDFDMLDFLASQDNIDHSDWSTPPPLSDLSASNTPDTRLTEPYTASPSPRSDFDRNGQLGTSPRAFACDQCHRVFDQIHKLNHHKRYHDRPHECPHPPCVMRFGTKTHLARHVNDKHRKTRKFYCTQQDCPYSRSGGKSFPRKDNWRRHMMNKHHITPDSDPGPQFVDDLMDGT